MAQTRKQKRAALNQQWAEEEAIIQAHRQNASHNKAAARAAGYALPFFDYLDSFTDEFNRVVQRAKREFSPYLFDVIETDGEMLVRSSWDEFRIPASWKPVVYYAERPTESSTEPTTIYGVVHTFRTPENERRLLVLILKSIKTNVVYTELKYGLKIAFLLHELGHVRDIIDGRHFDPDNGVADPLNAEVSANCYALDQCRKNGYAMTFANFVTALRSDMTGFRGEVARKTFETCDMTPPKSWEDYMPDDPGSKPGT
jgi:hypothetical protein